MKPAVGALLVLLLSGVSPWSSAIDKDAREAFDRLLIEAGLHIETPQDFSVTPVLPNPILPYEHAFKHKSGALEVRFIIRPLSRITIDYSDPHNAAPEPDHLFPLLFESVMNRLSTDSDTSSSTFSAAIAESSFNANWAAAAVFDVNPKFASGYQSGLLIAMHRNQLADAYTLFLYNDDALAKPLISNLLSVMSFSAIDVATPPIN
ncbi:MAG: hypothetical protein LJE92_05830 [Gammaproteobacteria bacterium]|jgi:hypothetical protein|nr:hypothetical protein [Gammaproteobacteria bacterium]